MNESQANLIRLRFYNTSGWDDFSRAFPDFQKALESLPDMTGLKRCNSILQEMVNHTIKDYGFDKK